MNFSTVTTSGVFQYVQKDSTKKIDIPSIEYSIVEQFNAKFKSFGITLNKYSMNLDFAFVIVAESNYNTDGIKNTHPEYSSLLLSTGYLSSIADEFGLKCTRKGT